MGIGTWITQVWSGSILIYFGSGIVNMFSLLMQVIIIKERVIKLSKTICIFARSFETNHCPLNVHTWNVFCLNPVLWTMTLGKDFNMLSNERWRYNVTTSLIGWAHTHNDPCMPYQCQEMLENATVSRKAWKCNNANNFNMYRIDYLWQMPMVDTDVVYLQSCLQLFTLCWQWGFHVSTNHIWIIVQRWYFSFTSLKIVLW